MSDAVLGPWSAPSELAREGGGKAANLLALDTLGVRVPAWCCIPAAMCDRFVASLGGDGEPASGVDARTGGTAALDDALRCTVRVALARLALADDWVAVRSSALGEDSVDHSFAGQFSSFLFQRGEDDVVAAVRQCWASAFSARSLAYRRATGAAGPVRMGVILQRMIDAESAGVVFSRNPLAVADRSTLIIESVHGLGEGLVSGAAEADRFTVDRATLAVRSLPVAQTHAVRAHPAGGTHTLPLDSRDGLRPSVTEAQVRDIASTALRLERALGAPQDCEFAVAAGTVYWLQTRPITTLPADALFDARVVGDDPVIWDNANIIESFAGVTTPLTFTHVNRCYREVYEQFARFMGVRESVIAANDMLFRNMLGFVRGRIYYNLGNWYRLLGFFPLVSRSKGFMETMMGVRQSLPAELASLFETPAAGQGWWRRARLLVRTTIRLARSRRSTADFMRRIERVYGTLETQRLDALSLSEQLALYRRLEREVLQHWTAPIVNDTRCMVAFGVLRGLTQQWLPDAAGEASVQNDLLCGEGDLRSAEPTKLLMRIAERISQGEPAVRDRFLAEPPDRLWLAMGSGFAPDVRALFDDLLHRFGFRCANELKLEEPDLHDDPRFLVASVQTYLRLGTHSVAAMEQREQKIRGAAEQAVRGRLSGPRRWLYFAIVRWARQAMNDREMLRFERTRTFGVTRRLFRGIGTNLVRIGALAEMSDVFYLTFDELMSFVEGRSISSDLRPLVTERRRECDEYRRTPAPPDRFLTRGAVGAVMRYPGLLHANDLSAPATGDDAPNVFRGTPCSPGIVEGAVRVAERFEDASDGMHGEILVTERTDPGWVPLFPACGGLIIERGSVLSHSAVVARELGIPTIVGVTGNPVRRLTTGQRVRMDGGTGEIVLL